MMATVAVFKTGRSKFLNMKTNELKPKPSLWRRLFPKWTVTETFDTILVTRCGHLPVLASIETNSNGKQRASLEAAGLARPIKVSVEYAHTLHIK